MSENIVDAALLYFSKFHSVLGCHDEQIEDCFYSASSEKKAFFLAAVIDEVVESNNLSENILLGALTLVVDWTYSDLPYSLFSHETDSVIRENIIEQFYYCFEKIFSIHCDDGGSVKAYSANWNLLCFMWWELLPRHGIPYREDLVAGDIAILKCLEKILCLENKICKKSALHGLGNWCTAYPDEVRLIIINNMSSIPKELVDYAFDASRGNAQ